MGSSYKKHSKSVSSKAPRQRTNDRPKKHRCRDVSSASSDDYSSSTDSEDNHKMQKKSNKKVMQRSKRSLGREAQRLRNKKKLLKRRHSRSVERRKVIRKKRKVSSSSYSCSTCSERSGCSSDERGFRKRRRLEPEQLGTDNKKKRRGRSPSRSFPYDRTYNRSSFEPPKQVGSIDSAAKKMDESKIGQSYKSENNAETIQSYDDYPSSRSNESNDDGGRVRQIESGDCSKLPARTSNSDDLAECDKSKTDDQVEAQLRQKALENFAKFRLRHLATMKESIIKLNEESVATSDVENFESNEPVRPPRIRSVVVAANVNNELPPVEAGGKVLAGEPLRSEIDQDQHATNAPESASQSDNSIRVDEPRASAPESSLPVNNMEVPGTSSSQKGEAEGGTQLQQKTMTVMRGGELVQVTYKVHIPKTTPALARRRLRS